MIFFDILVWLAVAKIAVLMLEDASYAVRGKQSPRRLARERHRAQEQKASGDGGSGKAPAGRSGGSAWSAADGYVAGLIEDATAASRARRRRAAARKRGAQAVDGVFVDVAEDSHFYADCDVCGWHSRPYRIEANARGAGREHTRTEHPDQYSGGEDQEVTQDNETTDGPEAVPPGPDPVATGRPTLRVIPGGAEDQGQAQVAPVVTAPASQPAQQPGPVSSVVHTDQHPYCVTPCSPQCTAPAPRPLYIWRCSLCGSARGGHATEAEARTDAAQHVCPTPNGDQATAGTDTAVKTEQPTTATAAADSPTSTKPSSTLPNTLKEMFMSMNLEATGPEEIRAAFTTAAEAAGERSEEVGGVAGVLTEAADRYEGLDMAASTVGHLRDAAEQFAAAQAALTSAQEELQAALADFNAKDGQVAEAVADAGGNVASKEVLVG
ncbi:hypothetical protein AWW66_22275 [Micromonospora rosaria]|uniref:Uncharacterized protein n=1 Tax=Micromonospora rosaria TaxID=47874 RepID=A0A136PN03_9ACTN|nr:hypothetical protein [Micromonospora rosaria]KXK59803.1 hypothetical protein AWW66_22275 [Micromonospora rosaria]